MPTEIQLPRLGWSMEEGTFVEWLKADGDPVREGEPLFVVEGDKASQEVEAIGSGRLHRAPDAPRSGEVVAVGRVLGWLLAPGEAPPTAAPGGIAPASPAPSAGPKAAPGTPSVPQTEVPPIGSEFAASPRARRAARRLGVDLSQLQPGGRGGRIRERDVLAAAEPDSTSVGTPVPAGMRALPVSALRRTIAHRLVASHRDTVPVTLTRRCDATAMVALRARLKSSTPAGIVPGITDILIHATARALAAHPLLAGRWDGDRILVPEAFHIGLAVDTDAGLVVPVIRHAGTASLDQIASQSRRLIAAARSGPLPAADIGGACFTVTTLGALGIEAFTPVINPPESAILGVGAIRREVVVLPDGQFAAREQMTLSLTVDHRVIDGAPAARFLQDLCRHLEEPPPQS